MISRILARRIAFFCFVIVLSGSYCIAADWVGKARMGDAAPNEFEVVYRGASLGKGVSGLRIWGTAYYDQSDIEPEYGELMDSETTGFLVGLELKRRGGSVWGAYYHYASEKNDWENYGLNGNVKHNLFGITYHQPLPMCHFLVNANAGFDKYSLRFPNVEEIFPEGYQANVYPEFGIDIPFGGKIGFKPYWALHYHYLHYDEIYSAIDPSIGLAEEDYHGLNNLLGLRLNLVLGSLLSFQGRASWIHEFLKESPTSMSYFSSIPGQFTPIRTNFYGDTARDWAWFGAGAKISLGDRLCLFADYDLTLNARQTSHTISACLCIGF